VEIDPTQAPKLKAFLEQLVHSEVKPEDLAPGQIVELLVAAQVDQDRILLKLGQVELVAKAVAGLKIGQSFPAEVLPETTPAGEVILRLLSPPDQESGPEALLRAAPATPPPLAPALARLAELLAAFDPPPGAALDQAVGQALAKVQVEPTSLAGESLKALWTDLGLNLEARLAQATAATPPAQAERQALELAGQLKPILQALAEELRPLAQGRSRAELPLGLDRLLAKLAADLGRIATNQSQPEDRPLLPEAGPGQAGAESPSPSLPPHQPVTWRTALASLLKIPRPASARTSPQQLPAGLVQELARLKGAFLKETFSLLKSSAPAAWADQPGWPEVRAEAGEAVKGLWPRLVQAALTRPADLPALLRELGQALQRLPPRPDQAGPAQALLAATEEATRSLEAVQLFNVASALQQGAVVLPLPFSPAFGAAWGQVHFFQEPARPNQGQKSRPFRVVFLLDMSRLGPVRIDLSLLQKSLMINFFLSHEKAVAWVAQRLPALARVLAAKGFQVKALQAKPLPAAPPLESLTPAQSPRPQGGLVDLKA
jgi:hypothetical protein